MAITALTDPVRIPTLDFMGVGFAFSGSFYLSNTSPGRFAYIFQAPQTGEIDAVETFISFASGTNSVRWSIQDVDATGLPDGTEDAYRVVTKATGWQSVQPTSDGTGGGTRKAVTRGTFYAVVCQWDSTESGGYESAHLNTNSNVNMLGGTYLLSYGGSWSKTAALSAYPNLAVKYADGNYYPIANCRPASANSAATFNSGSTPDEIGLRLVPSVPMRVSGFWMFADLDGDCDVVLYDSSSVAQATLSLDTDVRPDANIRYQQFRFPVSVDLTAAATYRLALKPTSGTNVSLQYITVNAQAILQAWPCGIEWHYTARADAGAWTDTVTRRPHMGLIVDGFDAGGGGGGGTAGYSRGRVVNG